MLLMHPNTHGVTVTTDDDGYYRVCDPQTCNIPKFYRKEEFFDYLLKLVGKDAWDMLEIVEEFKNSINVIQYL